jgi:aminoglycoside phosphotransferase (APT) family kinase protein
VLERPGDLDDTTLTSVVKTEYGIEPMSIEYLPVGYGAHHWKIVAVDGTKHFVTVDDLRTKSWFGPNVEDTFAGLAEAYEAARSLAAAGLTFVVAPETSSSGEVVCRLGESRALSMTTFVDGLTLGFGAKPKPGALAQLQNVLAAVHETKPPSGMRIERLGDVVDEVQDGLRLDESHVDGPYSARLCEWLRENDRDLQAAVARLERNASAAVSDELVVTHGEPHWGNIIAAAGGLQLVDWDTIALAHAERDLWFISRDPNDLGAYAEHTTLAPQRELLEFYALAWTLRDVVAYVQYFTRPHKADAESAIAWGNLTSLAFL